MEKGKSGSSVRLIFIHNGHFGFYRQKKIPPDTKRISSMPNKIKYFIVLLSCFFIVNKTTAQSNNIYLDGDNYITLNNGVSIQVRLGRNFNRIGFHGIRAVPHKNLPGLAITGNHIL